MAKPLLPSAPENSSLLTKLGMKAWRSLPISVQKKTIPWIFILGARTEDLKLPKWMVEYGSGPVRGETCNNCDQMYQHWTSKGFTCAYVKGGVRRGDWCNLWEPGD